MSEEYPLMSAPLNEDHKDFLLEQLAFQETNLMDIQEKFQQFFKVGIRGEVIMSFRRENKELILERRSELYNQTSSIPIANAFPRLALAQSRIEDLAKNPRLVRVIRKFDKETGAVYDEEVKEIDDVNLRGWSREAREEEYLAKKLLLETIVKEIDKADAKKITASGFKPVTVNIGFDEEKKEE